MMKWTNKWDRQQKVEDYNTKGVREVISPSPLPGHVLAEFMPTNLM
jgi:hypothetical protein